MHLSGESDLSDLLSIPPLAEVAMINITTKTAWLYCELTYQRMLRQSTQTQRKIRESRRTRPICWMMKMIGIVLGSRDRRQRVGPSQLLRIPPLQNIRNQVTIVRYPPLRYRLTGFVQFVQLFDYLFMLHKLHMCQLLDSNLAII
jgi:hypothetical protein